MVTPGQIRAARALLGWSQDELARRAATSRRTITTIENNAAVYSPAALQCLVTALQLAGIEFFDDGARQGVSAPVPTGGRDC